MAEESKKIEDQIPRFDISAAVVKQLGEELITDDVTAIMELIKNSYDADADWVNITINTKDSLSEDKYHFKNQKGYIIIEDNGFGMNESELRNGWFIISLSGKRKMKSEGKTTPKGRTPLGDKGLGRMSTQRLGSKLEMITGKEKEDINYHVAFSWDDFKEETTLTTVPTFFEKEKKDKSKKGTELIISGLQSPENWRGKLVSEFIGQLSQLIFPFKDRRPFNVFVSVDGEKIDLDEIKEDLRKIAQSRFSFNFDGEQLEISGTLQLEKLRGQRSENDLFEEYIISDLGKDFYDFLTDPNSNKKEFITNVEYVGKEGTLLRFGQEFDFSKLDRLAKVKFGNKEKIANPGPFYGEIDDFDLRSSDEVESAFDSLSEYKKIVKNQAGIRIFRNGFGIKPFGIDGNDWLNLSKGQTSGSSFYGLRPGNIMGFIEISSRDNIQLQEKTDREGFIDNEYSRNFFLLTKKVVQSINELLEKTRRSYNEYKKDKAEENAGVKSISESIKHLNTAAEKSKKLEKQTKEIISSLEKTNAEVEKIVASTKKKEGNQSKEEKEALKLLETVQKILKDSQEAFKNVKSIIELGKNLEHDAKYLGPKVAQLESQLSEFSELAALGLISESLSHEIANIVDRLVETTRRIKKVLENSSTKTNSELFVYVENIKSIVSSLRKQLSHLSPSLKYVRETKEIISLKKFASETAKFYEDRFKKTGIKIITEGNDFEIEINKGKLTQIFDNIILNAEYWLKEKKKRENIFEPAITIRLKKPFIVIFDNGDGIDNNYDTRIFQPFVTAKPKNQGRGLGLFIVQQLLESSGCSISLLSERNRFDRKYIFRINFSSLTN